MRLAFELRSARSLTPLRARPREDAEQVTQALPGEPLTVSERRGGWARVVTDYGYPGWVPGDALGGPVDDAWLPPARVGDPVVEARGYLGTPYEWGGMTRGGIDCSGLVHMAFRRLGRLVPRDADQQEAAGLPVSGEELVSGDLVLYGAGGSADHVAFWLGGGRILHATRREGVDGVVEEPEPPHLTASLRGYVRL